MYSLDDIYYPKISKLYHISLLFSFTITTIVVIPAVYIILTQSKNARVFKFLLINQIFWAYTFNTFMTLTGLLPLLPVPAYFVSPPIFELDKNILPYITPVYAFGGITYFNAYFLSILYRLTFSTVFGRFQWLFENVKRAALFSVGLLCVPALLFLSILLIDPYDIEHLRVELLIQYPEIQELSKYESAIIPVPNYFATLNSTTLPILFCILDIYMLVTCISSVLLYSLILYQVFYPHKFLSISTYKNYCIVARAVTAQVITTTCLVIIPYSLQFLTPFSTKTTIILSLVGFFFPTYTLFFEILALSYFVKPYRLYLAKKYYKLNQ